MDPQEVEGECLAGEGSGGMGGGILPGGGGKQSQQRGRNSREKAGRRRGSDGCFIKALLSLLEIPTVY